MNRGTSIHDLRKVHEKLREMEKKPIHALDMCPISEQWQMVLERIDHIEKMLEHLVEKADG